MKLIHPFRIFPALALVVVAAGCNNSPTEMRIPDGLPNFDNGGSYGSGGRTEGDTVVTTASAGVNASPTDNEENGGTYGSGGMN
jgi:hypothetical protein